MSILVTFKEKDFDGYIRFVNSMDTEFVLDPRPILSGLSSGKLKITQSSMEFEVVYDGIIKIPIVKSETWIIEEA